MYITSYNTQLVRLQISASVNPPKSDNDSQMRGPAAENGPAWRWRAELQIGGSPQLFVHGCYGDCVGMRIVEGVLD